jgi:hypothetical protein
MDQELPLRIVLNNPPTGVDFGLQKGNGTHYETIQKQRSNDQDLVFEFTVRVKESQDKNPVLLGSFVQGPPESRFVYIDVGKAAGQVDSIWSRRMKVPLQGITSAIIEQVLATTESFLETRVPGTGKDDGPTCGTVKPFDGWQVRCQ